MHLPLTAVVSVVGMASLTQAAECYAQSRGSFCVNKGQLLGYGYDWCTRNGDKPTNDWDTYEDSSHNKAFIGKIGIFTDRFQCQSAWNDIVNSCHGSRNGGSWTFDRKSLNINFCHW